MISGFELNGLNGAQRLNEWNCWNDWNREARGGRGAAPESKRSKTTWESRWGLTRNPRFLGQKFFLERVTRFDKRLWYRVGVLGPGGMARSDP